jgi:hypothetical protein
MGRFFDFMRIYVDDFRRGKDYEAGRAGMKAMIANNPRIVDIPSNYPGSFRQTPLWEAIHLLSHNNKGLILFLLDNGARNLNIESNEPTLIQAIELAHPPTRDDRLRLIDTILYTLSPEELKQRSSTGQTPYVVAIQNGLPEDILEKIRIATDGNDTNKNIYGRTAANYRRNLSRSRAPAGGMRKSRRSRRRSATRRKH